MRHPVFGTRGRHSSGHSPKGPISTRINCTQHPTPMAAWLVFLGGGFGSLCRWSIGRWLAPISQNFPWATLAANALSSFILGVVAGLLLEHSTAAAQPWRMLIITGFCGGFSTYSSFTFDSMQLLQSGDYGLAIANVAGTFALCLAVMTLGVWLGRSWA